MRDAILALHALATIGMAGLIWFVQVVHYPLFAHAGGPGHAGFTAYEQAHQARTTLIVAPLMFVELGTAAWLALRTPDGISPALAWTGLALVAVVWLSTFFVQVPLHGRLSGGFDARAHALLVGTNWVRTIAWTARAGLAVWMLGRVRG